MRLNVTFWKWRALELTLAVCFLAGAFSLFSNLQMQRKEAVAPALWFRVNDIFVPDMKTGDNPIITYDRTIRENFRGFWVTEVQRRDANGSWVLECSGSGINDYEIQDYIPGNQVRFKWYVGDGCADLPAGQYRLRSSWIMRKPSWPDKSTVAYSNLFWVR